VKKLDAASAIATPSSIVSSASAQEGGSPNTTASSFSSLYNFSIIATIASVAICFSLLLFATQ
jgi:hypothetical protein